MAYYKVGKKILNEDEYEQHANEMWAFALFLLGAFLAGMIVLHHLPADWSKAIRYALVLGVSLSVGVFLGAIAHIVRMVFFIGMFLGLIAYALNWLWGIV
jgi:hypothetical protein